ncbi:hypothetical protein ACVIGB_000134 [Bradyrhizobium sp. USDA 4341]
MTTVTIIEVRSPLAASTPNSSNVESDLAFVASSRDKALAFMADHSTYRNDGHPWCWYIYNVTLDDPKMIPYDRIVIGTDGQTYESQRAAWAACQAPHDSLVLCSPPFTSNALATPMDR